MHLKGSFDYSENNFAQVAALPYAGEELYMILALPLEKDGLPELEAQLGPETIDTWIEHLSPQKLNLTLPKFTMRSRFSLLDTLQAMGFTDISDFSGITNPSPFLTKVIHEGFLDINEHGTEAAAATAVSVGRSISRDTEFHADHPFLLCIYDSTSKSILFLGRVADPSE